MLRQTLVSLTALVFVLLGGAARAAEFEGEMRAIAELAATARYGEALTRAEALAGRVRAAKGETADFARVLGWQAYLLQVQGRFSDADPLFHQSLAVLERVLPPGHQDIATSLNNLGFQYHVTDRLAEAEGLLKRAIAMRERAMPASSLLLADSLNNLAQVYKAQGRVLDAEPLLRRALELRAKQLPVAHPLIAQSLQNLAGVLERQDRIEAAEPLLRKALEIRAASQTPDHPEIAGITSKIAQNLYRQNRFSEAQALFDRALEMRGRSQSPDHVDVASTLHDSALNLLALRRTGEARTALERALSIRRAALPPSHPDIARTLADLARVSMQAGNRTRALDEIKQAIQLVLTRERLDDAGRRQMAEFVAIVWELFGAEGETIPLPVVDEVLLIGQRATATPTAAAVARMAARFSTKDPELQTAVREREARENDLAGLERDLNVALAASRSDAADKLRRRIEEQETAIRLIDARLKRDFPGYFALVRPEPLSVDTVRKLLKPDEALVSYVATADGVFVWAVTHEAVIWRRVAATFDEIADKVGELRAGLDIEALAKDGTKARLFDLGLAHRLYELLLAPVQSATENKRQLLVVATGPVTSLPFQVLVTKAPEVARPTLVQLSSYRGADWLIRRHAVTVLPSISNLMSLRQVAGGAVASRSLIGFGNPEFSAPQQPTRAGSKKAAPQRAATTSAAKTRGYTAYWRGGAADLDALRRDLPALPETEAELKTIAQRLGTEAAHLVLGSAATEAAVKRADLDNYRIVYFATHGLVAGEIRGLGEPALALTLPAQPSDTDDGLLTASEVAQLKLDADWVVLSACNTAAGESPGAEALSGLARSFFHAGARAMLVSHWRVGSEAAARLTTATFSEMARDRQLGRAEALRRAMLDMTNDAADPWSAYPAFWAPFSVVGAGE